jgi:hypothetical protein
MNWDQEDLSWKPVQTNSSGDPILKIPNIKKGFERVAQATEHLPRKHEALYHQEKFF